MRIPAKAKRLRIYTGEMDRLGTHSLSDAIVEEAARRGMAGATVLRGMSGYGANSRVKSDKILVLSQDLPIIIEIVDAAEKIDAFLPWLDESVKEGLVTLDDVEVIAYRHTKGEKG